MRRLLQGRIDIVRAELRRRTGDERGSLVDQLAGHPGRRAGRSSRTAWDGTPPSSRPASPSTAARSSSWSPTSASSDVVNRTDDELAESLSRLTSYEAAVSRNRRRVQEVMDACTAEIARRYQSGEATVDDLLAGR